MYEPQMRTWHIDGQLCYLVNQFAAKHMVHQAARLLLATFRPHQFISLKEAHNLVKSISSDFETNGEVVEFRGRAYCTHTVLSYHPSDPQGSSAQY